MIENANENAMEVKIVISTPENVAALRKAAKVSLLDDEEDELTAYAKLVAIHLEQIMETHFLEDEAQWAVSEIAEMGMSGHPEYAINLIKAVFLSANNVNGRKAKNRAIDLCGGDESLYAFFISELLETKLMDEHIADMYVENDESIEED